MSTQRFKELMGKYGDFVKLHICQLSCAGPNPADKTPFDYHLQRFYDGNSNTPCFDQSVHCMVCCLCNITFPLRAMLEGHLETVHRFNICYCGVLGVEKDIVVKYRLEDLLYHCKRYL